MTIRRKVFFKILSRTGRLGNSSITYEFRDKLLYSNGGSHPSGLLRRSELQRDGGTQILFNGVSSLSIGTALSY